MTYLIAQLLTCLLLAAIFGLLVGWLLWGALVRRLRHQSLETQLQVSKLSELPGKLDELQTQHSALLAAKESEAANFSLREDESKQALSAKNAELEKLRMNILDNDALHNAELSKKDAYAVTLSARIAELEPVAAQAAAAGAKCQDELQIRDGRITELETKLRAVALQHSSAMERIGVLEPLAARIPTLEAEVANHAEAHTGKDQKLADLAGHLVELGSLAAMVPVLKGAVAEHESHIGELKSSLAAKDAEITDHAEVHASKDRHIADLAGHVVELGSIAATVPTLKDTVAAHEAGIAELQSSLAAKQAEIDGHAEMHSGKDRQIGDLAGQIVELGSLAAAVPTLKDTVAAHEARIAELQSSLAAKQAEIADHAEVHANKDRHIADLAGHMVELGSVAAMVPALKGAVTAHESHIAELQSSLGARDIEIASHIQTHAEKDVQINGLLNKVAALEPATARLPDLESAVAAKDSRLAELESAHAEKDRHIGDLHNRVSELAPIAARVPGLEAAHAAKDLRLAELQTRVSELEPLATWTPELEAAINAKDVEIAKYVEAHNLKDQQLSNLRTRVAELEPVAARVPELEAAHAEKDERIEALLIAAQGTELAGHIASDSEKDAQLASRLMQLKTVEPSPSKDAEIDALRSRLQEAEYEASVAAARLRMTHDDEATKEYEIADLRLRIRELSDQLEVSQAERASALAELEQVRSEPLETPKAMAAAAGFYDSGVGQTVSSPLSLSPKEAEEAQFQDRIQEYESRIEELQHVEAHKDQEISLLRLRLADLQTLPEPLARQQIQLSAKDAELEQMRRLLDSLFEPLNHSDVALCAFGFAQARNFQNGSAEEDWLRAERQVYHNRLNWAREWSEQQGFF